MNLYEVYGRIKASQAKLNAYMAEVEVQIIKECEQDDLEVNPDPMPAEIKQRLKAFQDAVEGIIHLDKD